MHLHLPGTESNAHDADHEKRDVALSSLLAAVVLTGTKLGVGLWTNSLGILSEAAHSGLDLVAAAVTVYAVKVSAKPADPEHPYGHGKVENLSALFETLLLVVTCFWIIKEAVSRLFFHEQPVAVNVWSFLVVLLSIAVDYSRSRALKRVADKYESRALEADALHFSTDIWSSGVVLVGLFGVLAAHRLGIPWLAQADSVAALGVAVIVVKVCYRLGRKAVDELLDTVPPGLHDRIAKAAQVPGVREVRLVRVRRSGPEVFADVTLAVGHEAGLEGAHGAADRAEAAIKAILPKADVVVHVEPMSAADSDLHTAIRALAARSGLGAHSIRIYDEDGKRSVELHLEVDDRLRLEEAHAQATAFEEALRKELPAIAGIITHIEPAGESAATFHAQSAGQAQVQAELLRFLAAESVGTHLHDIRVRDTDGELAVSLHCTLDPATAIKDAHGFTERLEKHLRSKIPLITRVLVHVEPPS
ncbi:MAG TPA: cation transporter [Elusimicrobia bacterium]|nr:cation transporter [Elusimicrobiota bacterium]